MFSLGLPRALKFECDVRIEMRKEIDPNQSSDRGATIVAFPAVLCHGFATRQAESHMLAVASIQIRGGSTAAA